MPIDDKRLHLLATISDDIQVILLTADDGLWIDYPQKTIH